MGKLRNSLVGQKFGLLTVIKRAPNQKKQVRYECQCECGKTTLSIGHNLVRGAIQSCGCRRKRTGPENPNWKGHGELSRRYWSLVLVGADERNLKVEISIEDAWKKYQEQQGRSAISGVPLILINLKNTTKQTASLDRIDSLRGYTLDNIQWIHKDLQWMKGTFSQLEFLSWTQIISNFQKGLTTNISIEAPTTGKSSRWMTRTSRGRPPTSMA